MLSLTLYTLLVQKFVCATLYVLSVLTYVTNEYTSQLQDTYNEQKLIILNSLA
jgi:hypothetical protein